MTFNPTELKIEKALLDYQNGRHDTDRLTLGELSTALTGLFFSLADILRRGQDELPRTVSVESDDAKYLSALRDGGGCTHAKDKQSEIIWRSNGGKCKLCDQFFGLPSRMKLPPPKPEPIRMSAANHSLTSEAYITGTKDGLAVASRLVDQTLEHRETQIEKCVSSGWGEVYKNWKTDTIFIRELLRRVLTEETNRTEKAQEGN